MELIAKIVMLASCAVCVLVQTVYFTHMMQLNSYRNERYRKWCKDHEEKVVNLRRLLPALLLPIMWLPGVYSYYAAGAVLLLTAGLNIPKKAKKPLVFTHRVWRLLGMQALLLLLVLTGAFFVDRMRSIGMAALYSLVVWVWTLVSNFLLGPLEKALANRYVKDARRRLEAMPGLLTIGVTGSYGKTSTKNFLHALLSVKYNVLMTPESYNTTLGVVRTIRESLRPTHQVLIAEMGAKNPGDIREICDLVHPRYGVLTSVGEQHLETFRTVENIVKTKFELIDALPAEGRGFLNTDNEYICLRLAEGGFSAPLTTYGLGLSDVTASDIQVDGAGTSFLITAGGESRRFTTRLLGLHNVQNITGCIAVALELGIPLEDLVYPVRMLKPVEHRLQLLPGGIIDDAYNSNPAGFRSALDVLAGFQAERILVTPGMVELGDKQDELNRQLGEYAAARCDYAVLVGERQAPPLKEGLLAGGFPEERIFVAPTLQAGLAHLREKPAPGLRITLLENDLPDNFE